MTGMRISTSKLAVSAPRWSLELTAACAASSLPLVHHPPRSQVTVIKDEAVVGAAGRHEVRDRLRPLEVQRLDHLRRDQRDSEPESSSNVDLVSGGTLTLQSELMCRAAVTTV